MPGGNYTVTVTDANLCSSESTFEIASTIDVADIYGLTTFSLQPSLTNGLVHINLETEAAESVILQVVDPTGRLVQVYNSKEKKSHAFELNLDQETNGIYFVRLQIKDQILTRKVVLAK